MKNVQGLNETDFEVNRKLSVHMVSLCLTGLS